MAVRAPIVLLAAAVVVAASAIRADMDSDNSVREWKEHPVGKVVRLLQDMSAELEDEAKKDQELYDKLACWCETYDKEKTAAIASAKNRITELTAAIEENTAKDQKAQTEVKDLTEEIAANTNALEEATAVREKELAEFNQNEKDMISSLQSLKGAVVTLEKHHSSASALVQREALLQLTHSLRRRLKQQPRLLQESVAPHQRRALMSLLQQPEGFVSLLQQPMKMGSLIQSYGRAPPSGEIFGMLKQMKESFETNLEDSKKEEAESAAQYVQLKASKEQEIKAGKDKTFAKTEEAAEAQKTVADSSTEKDNMETALAADTEFLANLKKKCTNVDAEFEMRTKTRQEEMKAVADTIAFLDSDEAHDLFTKSVSLLQLRVESGHQAVQREKARQFLEDAGHKLGSRRISYLATRMRFDPFGKMRESIDQMTGALGKEKDDEIVFKDECVDDFNVNDKQSAERTFHKDEVETEINVLVTDIKDKTEEENTLMQEIADAQIELKKASENREAENKEFQVVISDQRATQAILDKAVERLKQFYDKKAAASLLQRRALTARQTPGAEVEAMPEGFAEYKKSDGGGAVAMINEIIAESKAVETDAIKAETDAQAAYEIFVQDTNKEIETDQKALTEDEEIVAQDKTEEVADEADKRSTITDILKLGDVNHNLHSSCDFTLDNFETRQHARDDEIEALKQSKAIFSGATMR